MIPPMSRRFQFSDSYRSLAGLTGYFHEDWPVDHEDADSVLAFYMNDQTASELAGAIEDIDALLLRMPDDNELKTNLISRLTCSYDPTLDGWPTCRAWLQHIRDTIISRLSST
jgi:hypothetical protein